VASGRQQPVAVGGKADGVALDPFQHAVGEHDVLARDRRQGVELDPH
jgi:hypothetical protein